MKVLTIKQPYATLIAEGIKEYEFRTWKTKYRGELLIHAGKGKNLEYIEKFKHLNLGRFSNKEILYYIHMLLMIRVGKVMHLN